MRRLVLLFALVGSCIGALVGYVAHQNRAAAPLERRPAEHGWTQRTFPYFQADPAAYRQAFAQAKALKAATKTSVFGTWQPAGPTNIGGRIVDVAYDPQTPSTIYAASATGGVFKSTNSGQTWFPIFDDQPLLTIGDIAIDPSNPQTLYVGTGEANGGHNNFAGGGLYKSTDGGATWTFLGLEGTVSIGRILVHPTLPERVYVAAVGSYFGPNPERGVFRSDDGGETWQQVLFINDETGVVDLILRPDNPDVLLAAAWQRVRRYDEGDLAGPSSGIYQSTDGGITWDKLGTPNGLPGGTAGRIGLAVCASAPRVMYAVYTDGFVYTGLYRSDDGGNFWQDADPNRSISSSNFSWYFGQVRVHPTNPDQVYVMDVMFQSSSNGGQTWQQQAGTHVDHHALAFHPTNPNTLINGNDGGLALSTNGGQTWQRVNNLPLTQFYEIGLDPSNPKRLYGGTQDNGTLRTTTGRLNDWTNILGGDGFYVIVDPSDPNIVYAESQNGGLAKVRFLANGNRQVIGATAGIDPSEPRNWSTPLAMDPVNPQVLYFGTNRLYRTENGAANWTVISPDLTKQLGVSLLGTLTTIAVAPTNADVIYVGTDDGNVWVTGDYGSTWTDITAGLPMRWVTRVAVDPTDENIAYVTFSGLKWQDPQPHVFRTDDRGQTWQDISNNLPDAPVNAFAIDPSYPTALYVGTDIGAFVSLNTGSTWEPLGEGMPPVSVYDFKIYDDGNERFLIAGTHGRSMYKLDLPDLDPATASNDQPTPSSLLLAPAYPNPFSETLTVQVSAPPSAAFQVGAYDLLGRRVATLFSGNGTGRLQSLTWDGTNDAGQRLAAGVYLLRLQAGPDMRSQTVVLQR